MTQNIFNRLGAREVVPYHRGELALDCAREGQNGDAARLRKQAWQAHLDGKVALVQERVGPGVFVYKAIGLAHH